MFNSLYNFWKNNKYYLLLNLVIVMFYVVTITFIEFSEFPISTLRDRMVMLFQCFCIGLILLPVIAILTINRWFCILTLPILFMVSAAFGYMRLVFHIMPTPELVDLIMVNNWNLGIDFVNWYSVATVIVGLLVGIIFSLCRWHCVSVKNSGLIVSVSVLMWAVCIFIIPQSAKQSIFQRMPFSFYNSIDGYVENHRSNGLRECFLEDISCDCDSITVVVVLGESLRSDHMSLNGYYRNTMPYLSQRESVVSYPNIYSPEIFTHTSLPVILTRAESMDDEEVNCEYSFISIFRKAGFYTSWISNQDIVSTYKDFVNEAHRNVFVNAGKSVYVFSKWTDMSLIPEIKRDYENNHKKKLIVIHTIGSHWFYNSHFEESRFVPILDSKMANDNNCEKLKNSYDNTIVETDKFLEALLTLLEKDIALVIYISDHGESLGENGKFLHAEDNDVLHYPGMFVWCSKGYQELYHGKVASLKRNSVNSYGTDIIFHSVLDGSLIQSDIINTDKSIFR